MNFIEKNLFLILFAIGAFACAILLIVPLIMSPIFNFIAMSQILGLVLFFLGVGTYYILKMFDKTREHKDWALLATGVLTLIFLGVGLAGFKDTTTKAEGAMGNAYASFKTSQNYAAEREDEYNRLVKAIALCDEAGKTLADLKPILPEAFVEEVGEPDDPNYQPAGAFAGYPLATPLSMVKDGLVLKKAGADIEIKYTLEAMGYKSLNQAKRAAQTGAFALLATYLTTMLAFGLFPAIKGMKKALHFAHHGAKPVAPAVVA